MPQPGTSGLDWIPASKLKFHCPSAVGPESVAVQLRANPGPFGPPTPLRQAQSGHAPFVIRHFTRLQKFKPQTSYPTCQPWGYGLRSDSRVTPQATHSAARTHFPHDPPGSPAAARVETQILAAQPALQLPPATLRCLVGTQERRRTGLTNRCIKPPFKYIIPTETISMSVPRLCAPVCWRARSLECQARYCRRRVGFPRLSSKPLLHGMAPCSPERGCSRFTSHQSAVGPDSLNRRSGWSWCADPDTQQPGLRLSSLHRTYRIHNCMSELLSHPITRTMPTGHRTALAASTPSYRIGLPTAEPEHAMATPLKPLDCGNRE